MGNASAPFCPLTHSYEVLEERGAEYAIRIPANENLVRGIAELLTRPVGRPRQKLAVWYEGTLYQAASWKTALRVVAKVEKPGRPGCEGRRGVSGKQ